MLKGWIPPDKGVLFVITGPSGVGKSTLIRASMARIPQLRFSVSATTRDIRKGEHDGVDYRFLARADFDKRVAAGDFLEHATVYDRSYGTLRQPTAQALSTGASLILDIDAQGAAQVRKAGLPHVSIFLLPPSLDALERRLRARGTDNDEIIACRMAQVGQQIEACGAFDYLVVNDHLSTAQATLDGILLAEMSRRNRRESLVQEMLGQLIRGSHRT